MYCIHPILSILGFDDDSAGGGGLSGCMYTIYSLPLHLKDADISYCEFRRSLKTFLFG